ncbi:Small ribosomal subunit protein bS1A-like protein [Drosera capensis]
MPLLFVPPQTLASSNPIPTMQNFTAPSSLLSLPTPFPLSRISSNTSSAPTSLFHDPRILGKSNHVLRFRGHSRRADEVNLSSTADEVNGAVDDSSSDFSASVSRTVVDWDSARTYKDFGLTFEGKVEGRNRGETGYDLQEMAQSLVGSIIAMKVVDVDEGEKRLIFSEAQTAFNEYKDSINVGDTFDGRVGPVKDFGAFIYLCFPDGNYYLKGLLHKSEISWDFVQNPGDFLNVGDIVRVKVISIDRETARIYLSIKQLEEDPLLETFDKVIHQQGVVSSSSSTTFSYVIKPLPGLTEILDELLREQGIDDVKITRQGFERRVVSPDLQIWLSNVSRLPFNTKNHHMCLPSSSPVGMMLLDIGTKSPEFVPQAPSAGNKVTLLARAGRQVQEIELTTSFDHDGVKQALQHALERVP